MKRIVALVLTVVLAACSRGNIENKDAVRQAVIDYLQSRKAQTGLDVSTMDVTVTAMQFERDVARATVSFTIKNTNQGMQKNYTLDRNGDKWVVRPETGGDGHGVVLPPEGAAPTGALPPGHPAVPATPQAPPPAGSKQ